MTFPTKSEKEKKTLPKNKQKKKIQRNIYGTYQLTPTEYEKLFLG